MSKHPSDNTKRNLLRRGLAGILFLALILGLLPSTIVTAHAASWADPYVQTLVDWGVMRGDIGGNMAPDRSITRAEFVTMMNRAYGYTKLGGHPFTDVRNRDWYNQDIDIAYNIGYFKGTGPTTASPNDTLTREQAAVLLARNMMLQETVGETLGFSDTRILSDWSRGLVGAAAANGIISGYEDGSFQPMRNITRGEVAAMLVRAIGTPIQTEGDHALGNVYGNVTVNTSGVKLRDGVIVGNLYLTGGIDLGDVLLENVTVLGEIIVSGGGESNSSQSSIILRNVTADNMVVDSIGSQFVTIRAEGNTDIPTTVVRTNAYVDDSSLPGYGLSHITLDGESGALFQLAGNIKEVINRTPDSDMQIVQGSADKVTVDEYATGSSVLVDGDAVVGDLNLDAATDVTGTGDIKNLNVGAAGSTVEQLPDKIEIRPGITTDIAGSNMNSTQAAESSSDPRLLAGYPAVRKIAPTNAELVFRANKPGTIYWAVSAVADGSVSEADLLEPPVYGNKVLASGKITAASANTDYTAQVARLTSGGSYYVTAMLVDGRDQHSPIKVTSFSTPDNTVPAFVKPDYPYMSKVTCDDAQVTVMTNKSCLLYYALLPDGAAAPTPAEFKAASISGNLGYGSMSVTKNVTTPIHVNDKRLDEKTNYVLYLWLTDHDGAQSMAAAEAVRFTAPDETRPKVTSIMQTDSQVSSVRIAYTLDEPGSLVWAVVTESDHDDRAFLPYEDIQLDDEDDPDRGTLLFKDDDLTDDVDSAAALAAKVKLESGVGAVRNGTNPTSPFNITNLLYGQTNTTAYYLYYMGRDTAGNNSKAIKFLKINTLDSIPPKFVEQTFNRYMTGDATKPLASTDITLVFSENIQGGAIRDTLFKNLYDQVESKRKVFENLWTNGDDMTGATADAIAAKADYDNARENLGAALRAHFKLYRHPTTGQDFEVPERTRTTAANAEWTVDWRNARISIVDGQFLLTLPTVTEEPTNDDFQKKHYHSALKLDSGATYYFRVNDIYDLAVKPWQLEGGNPQNLPQFTTVDARVVITDGDEPVIINVVGEANPVNERIDYHFQLTPQDVSRIEDSLYWDMLIWFNANVTFTLYSRQINDNGKPVDANGLELDSATAPWTLEKAIGTENPNSPVTIGGGVEGGAFRSFTNTYRTTFGSVVPDYDRVKNMLPNAETGNTKDERKEYAIHLNSLNANTDYTAWTNPNVTLRVSVVAGTRNQLGDIKSGNSTAYNNALNKGVRPIETPSPYTYSKGFNDQKLPSIEPGTPNLASRADVSARITMRLDRPGKVHYLVLPLSELRDPNNANSYLGDNELMEAQLLNVPSFSAPIPLKPKDSALANATTGNFKSLGEIPLMDGDTKAVTSGTTTSKVGARVAITEPNFTQFTSQDTGTFERLGIIKGVTPEASTSGEVITIDLTRKLKANTAYVLCLLPSGISTVPDDTSEILCFRFTTDMMDIPQLLLTGTNNPTIEASVQSGTSALMEYFVVRKDKEDMDGVTEFHAKFETGANGLAKDSFDDFAKNHPGVTKPTTVLEAMATPLRRGSTFIGTAFDLYAKDNIKPTYVERIQSASSSVGGNDDVVWGEGGQSARLLAPVDTLRLGDHIEAGQDFTIVAMARRDETTEDYAFCAWYPVHKRDTLPPMVTEVTPNTDTQMTDTTDPTKNTGVKSGTVTLQFNSGLYNWLNNTAYPIDSCANGGHSPNPKDGAYALGNAATVTTNSKLSIVCDNSLHSSTSPTPVSTITLEVKELPGNASATITFGNYKITTLSGNGSDPNRASLTVTVRAVNINAGVAGADPYWELQATVNTAWNGVVTTR